MDINIVLFIVLFIWLVGLSVIVFWFIWLLKPLLKQGKEKDFIKIFKNILDTQTDNNKQILVLRKDLKVLENEVLSHVQNVGLVKYNPFGETGGDHSFSLTLLDGKKNGIIITSLHSRETTRVYIKGVAGGKSSIELSKEEKKSLGEAVK